MASEMWEEQKGLIRNLCFVKLRWGSGYIGETGRVLWVRGNGGGGEGCVKWGRCHGKILTDPRKNQ